MHLQSALAALTLLCPLISAAPDAEADALRIPVNKKYGEDDGTSVVLYATGTAAVPQLLAVAPMASATANFDSTGSLQNAQAVMNTIGNGPGMCPQDPNAQSYFFHQQTARGYNLFCGQDIAGQGKLILYSGVTWNTCLNLCAFTRNCDSVVYSRLMWNCWTKDLGSLNNPILNNNTDRYFAFLPGTLRGSWQRSVVGPDPLLANYAVASTTTAPIAALGTVTVAGAATPGTIASATASISNGTTLAVRVMIRWPGR